MLCSFWQWLNRPDTRARYPDGQLVIRGGGAAAAVARFFDLFPLWIQRGGLLVLRGVGWCVVAAVVAKVVGVL